jgi:hypothetical protein
VTTDDPDPRRASSPEPQDPVPGDHDRHPQDPKDEEQVREGRRIAIAWYLWPLLLLLAIMLIGYLASR